MTAKKALALKKSMMWGIWGKRAVIFYLVFRYYTIAEQKQRFQQVGTHSVCPYAKT